jgi:HD-GYP domain-containing protein (c-di-GMP phosphodiesterase class II)
MGRLGALATVWEKPGRLTDGNWEQVRLHPYLTERIFARSPALAPLGALGSLHHERVDGSGYHRGARGDALGADARLLAVADVWQALHEARPHRPALSAADAAGVLADEARAGRLDSDAVNAVLSAGQASPAPPARERTGGLTEREIEVLRLVARGLTNRQIGLRLSISAKTVGHHVQHIYDRIGVSSRAGATLWAAQQSLV